MNVHTIEFKEATVKKMIPPNANSVQALKRETGVSDIALYKWRNEYWNKGSAVPEDDINPEKWGARDKLAVVIETAAFNGSELGEYCRKKRLYPEQAQRWKETALKGHTVTGPKEHITTDPNEVLSWDITYLKSSIRGCFFYPYLFTDIYCRKIVGWEVHEEARERHPERWSLNTRNSMPVTTVSLNPETVTGGGEAGCINLQRDASTRLRPSSTNILIPF